MNFDVILIGLGIFGLPFLFLLVCFVIAVLNTNKKWNNYVSRQEEEEATEVYTYTEWKEGEQK